LLRRLLSPLQRHVHTDTSHARGTRPPAGTGCGCDQCPCPDCSSKKYVGCQNSVRTARNLRFAGRTLTLAPHTPECLFENALACPQKTWVVRACASGRPGLVDRLQTLGERS
jgi:hypothetical protein